MFSALPAVTRTAGAVPFAAVPAGRPTVFSFRLVPYARPTLPRLQPQIPRGSFFILSCHEVRQEPRHGQNRNEQQTPDNKRRCQHGLEKTFHGCLVPHGQNFRPAGGNVFLLFGRPRPISRAKRCHFRSITNKSILACDVYLYTVYTSWKQNSPCGWTKT